MPAGILERALPYELSIYGYYLTRYVTYIFTVLFAISFLIHVGLALHYKMKWLLVTVVLCSLAEALGWGGRVWSSYDPLMFSGFQIQICCTIIAPTFTLAGLFVIFGQIITRLGRVYSRISAKIYTWLFLTCDVVALVIQATGGGLASNDQPVLGGNIMLGGIAFQLCVLVMASILAAEFFYRYFTDKPLHPPGKDSEKITGSPVPFERGYADRKMKIMIGNMAAVAFLLIVRAIYRTIELEDGWEGTIITTEVYFNIFDGTMILLAQYLLIVFHPGRLLGQFQDTVALPPTHSLANPSEATVH